ncbi:DUF2335 domain-containing protein [Staphylococcus delphini]|uniref:DUF2335 domain-containing protein n=1 Tax=Staphylococcus delphini TaxID=53344 RepID=UPI0021D33AF9|nr:DUF2335 domain-containing protein [Staphylococcus delphini]UXS28577.1 DUF2335 domain-containing protein [Staphylococcus delphini]UXS36178.1 DUF2335 domain-containing protein [Staphylococcus delphini]UXS43589.1 DUF2335 domain-containing protein [Staphylococcus delphini]UXV44283.1 DUF2335 domain-containing protein [Staphylococcus delphini]
MADNQLDELEKEEQVLKRIINDADPEERKVIMRKLSITKSGPLPEAEEFKQYEDAVPGAGDRILAMAETEQTHRIDLTNKEQEKYYKSNNMLTLVGVICSMIVSVCGIAGAVILGIVGQSWAAGVIGTLSLGSIVANMLKATSNNSE